MADDKQRDLLFVVSQKCSDRYKVALPTYQFDGEAEYWWGIVQPRRAEDPMT